MRSLFGLWADASALIWAVSFPAFDSAVGINAGSALA